jgi:hypothetical protein
MNPLWQVRRDDPVRALAREEPSGSTGTSAALADILKREYAGRWARGLIARLLGAVQDSNLATSSCESGRGGSQGAGRRVETPTDLRERVSVTTARYPCVGGM